MKRMLLPLLILSCGAPRQERLVDPDSGIADDAGVDQDSGQALDAGQGHNDAGQAEQDAGSGPDAGDPADAGQSTQDAGPYDAGWVNPRPTQCGYDFGPCCAANQGGDGYGQGNCNEYDTCMQVVPQMGLGMSYMCVPPTSGGPGLCTSSGTLGNAGQECDWDIYPPGGPEYYGCCGTTICQGINTGHFTCQ